MVASLVRGSPVLASAGLCPNPTHICCSRLAVVSAAVARMPRGAGLISAKQTLHRPCISFLQEDEGEGSNIMSGGRLTTVVVRRAAYDASSQPDKAYLL